MTTYLKTNLNECIEENSDYNILATANLLCIDLALEDQIEDNLSDPSLFMPIKCLKKQKKKSDSDRKLGVAARSTRINKNLKIKK
jgi:hypothetical protein